MTAEDARRRFAAARRAHLATADERGRPHLVPMVFVLREDTIFSAVDAKPKRTRALRRLANIAANPHAAALVDHYAEDWDSLWWVRADGSARVLRQELRTRSVILRGGLGRRGSTIAGSRCCARTSRIAPP